MRYFVYDDRRTKSFWVSRMMPRELVRHQRGHWEQVMVFTCKTMIDAILIAKERYPLVQPDWVENPVTTYSYRRNTSPVSHTPGPTGRKNNGRQGKKSPPTRLVVRPDNQLTRVIIPPGTEIEPGLPPGWRFLSDLSPEEKAEHWGSCKGGWKKTPDQVKRSKINFSKNRFLRGDTDSPKPREKVTKPTDKVQEIIRRISPSHEGSKQLISSFDDFLHQSSSVEEGP